MSKSKYTPDELARAYEDGISDGLRVAANHVRVHWYMDADDKPLLGVAQRRALADRIESFNAQDVVAIGRERQELRGRVYSTPMYHELKDIAAAEGEERG